MISIIIPSLNEEKYIDHTLRSLKAQDYKGGYEIIVIDGGSKDKTVRIAKKYADRIIVIGKGVSKARNRGAKEAKGDVLMFIDADTSLVYNALTEFHETFKDKKVAAATCPVIPLSPFAKDFLPYWGFSMFMKNTVKTKSPKVAGICIACRKSAFDKTGGYDESLETGEDFDFSGKLAKLGKFAFIESTFCMTSPRRLRSWGLIGGVRKYIQKYIDQQFIGKKWSMEKYGYVR
jgi:glycosyltransferase involved in cell wall biosynthesis